MLLFAVFVRYNKTPIGFIFAQYGKILSFDFNFGLDLRSRPILKSQLNILPYCAQKNPISYNNKQSRFSSVFNLRGVSFIS